MLTKEEILKAHDNLCKALIKTDYVECVKGYTYQTMEDELEMFYQLINEHFELKVKYEKLVDKATPKKPIIINSPSYGYIEFECPNCHHITLSNFRRLYCGECGQKLDWGEDDDIK